jgi:hypothetical protein
MGCDIHFYTEKRNAETGKWEFVGEVTREGEGDEKWVSGTSLYDGRSYNLFAILANVRNGRGFAGCKTGEGFAPISLPRGIPEDASAEYREIVDCWDCDGHSHSYHTLRQLLDYDWVQSTQLQGWLDVATWLDWSRWAREQGFGPESYSGFVSGQSVQHLTTEQMDKLVDGKIYLRGNERADFVKQHEGFYGQAFWQVPYYRAAGGFMSETIPQLLAIAGGVEGIDNVRIVFFFDN